MDTTERIDSILEAVGKRLTTEIESLLATDFIIESAGNNLISKESAFAELKGKQICSQIEIAGDVSGSGCLLMGIKDGIRLGGTLIMLPVAELDEVIGREEYSEEVEDSYGEIANIITGAISDDFGEMYPKACRFIRKEQGLIVPKEVDVASSYPVEDELYYRVAFKMALEGRAMGNLILLLPAAPFDLKKEVSEDNETADTLSDYNILDPEVGSEPSASAGKSAPTISNRQQRIDLLFEECRGEIESGLTGLMGVDIAVHDLENRVMDKTQFLSDTVLEKQAVVDMEVVGDVEDSSYLAINVKDAIYLGGSLIMLPPNELEVVISEGDFGDDVKDAYGEIAKVISGIYTAVFEEKFEDKLQFVIKELREVSLEKLDFSSNAPIPDNNYYISTMSLSVAGKPLGQMHMLVPAEVFGLDEETSVGGSSNTTENKVLETDDEVENQAKNEDDANEQYGADQKVDEQLSRKLGEESDNSSTSNTPIENYQSVGGFDILLVSDDEGQADKIMRVLQEVGYGSKTISTKENIQNYIPGHLKAVYLVMNEVNERAFGLAIQVRSASSLPIIAAGPSWTRSKVIKAVKYGVHDILLTPASDDDIKENITNNLLKRAA